MHEGRVVLQRLHQVGRDRVLEQRGHRALRLQLRAGDGAVFGRLADHDARQALLQVGEARRQAQDGHDLRGDDDVEAALARRAVCRAAQADDDVAQRAVVHVDHALPGHAAHVEAERIAVVDVVVDHRREQVVRQRDGGEVAGEVQVDLLHRHHLRVAAAGRAALQAEHRPERGLAQADDGARSDAVERVAQAHGGGGLAFAGRRGRDRGHQHQLAVGPLGQRVQPGLGDLADVAAARVERFFGMPSASLIAWMGFSRAACAISMSDSMGLPGVWAWRAW